MHFWSPIPGMIRHLRFTKPLFFPFELMRHDGRITRCHLRGKFFFRLAEPIVFVVLLPNPRVLQPQPQYEREGFHRTVGNSIRLIISVWFATGGVDRLRSYNGFHRDGFQGRFALHTAHHSMK